MEKITLRQLKEEKMRKRHLWLVFALFIIVILSSVALSDVGTGIECLDIDDCIFEFGTDYLEEELECRLGECIILQADDPGTGADANETDTDGVAETTETDSSGTTSDLQTDITALTSRVANIEQKVTQLQSKINNIQRAADEATANVRNVQSQQGNIKTDLKTEINSISTGLAGLQDNVQEAKTDLEKIEEDLKSQQAFASFLKYALLILIVAVAGVFGVRYMTKAKGGKSSIDPKVMSYITRQVKSGRKLPQIKQQLRKSGWSDADIENAYQQTMKSNYQKYLEQKGGPPATSVPDVKPPQTSAQRVAGKKSPAASPTRPSSGNGNINKRKVMVIAIFGIFIVIGAIFLLKGITTGKAIHLKDAFSHEEMFECTPPHMVSPDGGCCLDQSTLHQNGSLTNNSNRKCDHLEIFEIQRVEESLEVCNDDRDCAAGLNCIDHECTVLKTIEDYINKDCARSKQCTVSEMEFRTSDGETYNIRGKKGGYTAAGALAWTVQKSPNYCPAVDYKVRVPIEITKSDLICYNGGGEAIPCGRANAALIKKTRSEIVGREIITLAPGETSAEITHPNEAINGRLNGFTLTLRRYRTDCFNISNKPNKDGAGNPIDYSYWVR